MFTIKIILFYILLMQSTYSVVGQRISETKCRQYSKILVNPSNPLPHVALWVRTFVSNTDLDLNYVTLISDKFLVTSAERALEHKAEKIQSSRVHFTLHDSCNITDMLIHPDYEKSSIWRFNIALLRISRIQLNSYHRPACLWSRGLFEPSSIATIKPYHYHNGDNSPKQPLTDIFFHFEIVTSGTSYKTDCLFYNVAGVFCLKNNASEVFRIGDGGPTTIFVHQPFLYLPNNYYIYGNTFAAWQGGIDSYLSIATVETIDWTESVIWGTDELYCGTVDRKLTPMATHTMPTEPEEFPWHVALYHQTAIHTRKYQCGGSLINEVTVVTAAHCVTDRSDVISPQQLFVTAGKHDLNLNTVDSRDSRVTRVKVHEDYNHNLYSNDIALLKLRIVLPYSLYIRPICLTSNVEIFENQIGILPGWGLNELREAPTVLRKASFPIRPNSYCREVGPNISPLVIMINENNLCAGYENGTALCKGDSGGGLVYTVGNHWFLRGVASVGATLSETADCDPLGLSLFTDVVNFYNWIMDGMEDEFN